MAHINIIEQNHLEDFVKESVARGDTYQHIVDKIMQEQGISITKMAISRYLAKHTDERIKPNKIYSNKHNLRELEINNTTTILANLDTFYSTMKDVVTDCKLPVQEKQKMMVYIESQHKILRSNILEHKAQIIQLFRAISQYDIDFKEALINVSRGLCLNCRKHISNEIQEYEKSIKDRL